VIKFDREHMLVMHGLCHEEEDGRFVFNAPCFGRGNGRNGICYAADCRLLDPELLTKKEKDCL